MHIPCRNAWLSIPPQYTSVYSSILQYIPAHSSTPLSTLQYIIVYPVHSSIPLSILQYTIVYHLAVDVAYRYQELQLPSEDSTLELTEKDDSTLELTQADDATPELTEDKVDLGNIQSTSWQAASLQCMVCVSIGDEGSTENKKRPLEVNTP